MNELEQTLKEAIVQGDLFSELLVKDEGGNLILRLPTEMKLPSLLRLPEEYQSSPIIFLRTPFDTEVGHLAYFPIRGLVAFQGILSEKKLADLRSLVEARQNFKTPAEIRRDSQEGFYYFDDGHHRGYLGLQAGHSHILGKIGRSYFRIRSPRFSMDQLRVIPHAEYQKIVNENEGGEGMSYTNILFKDLLEEERSHRISRILQSSDGQEHPFEIILPDLRVIQKASVGSQFPIAAREGRTLLLQVRTQDRAEYMDAFVPDGTPRTLFNLIEGEGRGQMEIFWTPDSISRYEIHTQDSTDHPGAPPLAPGAGTIVTEWLATQAALNDWGLNIFQIKNPRIIEILSRRRLMDLDSTVVEIAYWNDFWNQLVGTDEFTDLKNPERLKALLSQNPPGQPATHFINVRGRPNPDLVPPPLRSSRR